jgi:hypothetical protein
MSQQDRFADLTFLMALSIADVLGDRFRWVLVALSDRQIAFVGDAGQQDEKSESKPAKKAKKQEKKQEKSEQGQDDPPLDDDFDLPVGDEPSSDGDATAEPQDAVDLPLFGRLSVSEIGLPLFTIAIGLVDGFNPCAMWVLLFLLSILVNLRDRSRIIVVAGTFVVISGIAYFAFMAAWLNVFMMVGLIRWIQVMLGLLALFVGAIHIKDFFAFKKGLSLSIPESAKPGIYRRVRAIVTAEHLWGALVGAVVLAVLVNIVELLCTAGLPALYTEVLTLQKLPWWKNYAYLGLYILAYMFDDALMVTVVTLTLSKKKLQETEGKWLKLISGCVIFVLGAVMLIKPEWLH